MYDVCHSPRQVFVPEGTEFAAIQIAAHCLQNGLPLPFALPDHFAAQLNASELGKSITAGQNKSLTSAPTTITNAGIGFLLPGPNVDRQNSTQSAIGSAQAYDQATLVSHEISRKSTSQRQDRRLPSDSSEKSTESFDRVSPTTPTSAGVKGWADRRLIPSFRRSRDPKERVLQQQRSLSRDRQEIDQRLSSVSQALGAPAVNAELGLLRLGPLLSTRPEDGSLAPKYGAFGEGPISFASQPSICNYTTSTSVSTAYTTNSRDPSLKNNYIMTTAASGPANSASSSASGAGQISQSGPGYSHVGTAGNLSAGPLFDGTNNVTVPVGTESQIAGINIYSAGHRSDPSAVIVLPDLFGWRNVNTRLICDKIAEAGFLVIMPDLFNGDTLDFSSPGAAAAFPDWCRRHAKSTIAPICAKVLDYIEETVRPRLGTAAVGYCFGARYAAIANAAGRVRCSVISCPSFLEPDEWSAIQTPSLWLCAESDRTFTNEEKVAAQRALADKFFESQFVTYPTTEHGFCTRYHPGKRGAAAASKDALQRTIEFLRDTLYE
ncbi:SEA (Seh1-associated) complex subunit [Savitreella phatthalungensis]